MQVHHITTCENWLTKKAAYNSWSRDSIVKKMYRKEQKFEERRPSTVGKYLLNLESSIARSKSFMESLLFFITSWKVLSELEHVKHERAQNDARCVETYRNMTCI